VFALRLTGPFAAVPLLIYSAESWRAWRQSLVGS
jgi:hypothetical protein